MPAANVNPGAQRVVPEGLDDKEAFVGIAPVPEADALPEWHIFIVENSDYPFSGRR